MRYRVLMTSNKSSDIGLSKFHRLLVDQVRHEFTASHQYVAIAAWFDDHDLPQLARVFYEQSLEERDHAMMIVRFLLDTDVPFSLPGVDEIETDFAVPRDLVALALRQEREVTDQFQRLAKVARDEDDYTGEQFLQWFIQEQTEEVAKMSTLLNVVDRANGNLFHVEDFVARDMPSEDSGSQGAPGTAGPSVS
ncbi:Ferritin BfrB [Nocardiopsis dassonvillei]|jgi:ferritin|uniref:Ferritin n=2 Tax=Nocardiopsidaceae TaxID=83676 RepID=D7B2E4_NOCDD|nr:Ferritin Dps family protein [Nocardiopsis dassonvillei subsp. dassonvillei DSM 43111]VEI89110.1 Ferritin BfrB [Nocardiopsis dassonvillei]